MLRRARLRNVRGAHDNNLGGKSLDLHEKGKA